VTNINIIIITCIIGLVGYITIMITLTLLHKWKNINSFVLSENNTKIIIRNSKSNTYFISVAHFFLLSLSTILIVTDIVKVDRSLQLVAIYLVCLIIASIEFIRRRNLKVIIDVATNSIILKNKIYSLLEYNQFEIADRRFWTSDQIDSYGLYIKNINNHYKFIYGYSTYRDIEDLKLKVMMTMNRL